MPFLNDEIASIGWASLKKAFPEAGAAVLMPDHIHLVLPPMNEGVAQSSFRKFTGISGHLSKTGRFEWQPIPDPTRIADLKHLLRTLRYVALNPCRPPAIVGDPLEWRWSTYRELFGGSVAPWPGVGPAWELSLKTRLGVRIHDYVSTDPDVDLRGTLPPRPPAVRRTNYAVYDVRSIAEASLVVTEKPWSALERSTEARRYFVWLGRSVGWKNPGPFAEWCGMSKRAVHLHWSKEPPSRAEMNAGLVVLGEPRFRVRMGASRILKETLIGPRPMAQNFSF